MSKACAFAAGGNDFGGHRPPLQVGRRHKTGACCAHVDWLCLKFGQAKTLTLRVGRLAAARREPKTGVSRRAKFNHRSALSPELRSNCLPQLDRSAYAPDRFALTTIQKALLSVALVFLLLRTDSVWFLKSIAAAAWLPWDSSEPNNSKRTLQILRRFKDQVLRGFRSDGFTKAFGILW